MAPRKRKKDAPGSSEDDPDGSAVRINGGGADPPARAMITRRRAREAHIPTPESKADRSRAKNARRVPAPGIDGSPEAARAPREGPGGRLGDDPVLDAVVKVFCIHTEPNFSLPWQRKRQYSSSGSGFAIPGRRILTNAHCVDHHTQVKVKRRGSDVKYVAQTMAVGPECDIAMLRVDHPDFWDGLEPVDFGELPQLQDAVTVIGYPIGGDTMSVSSGVVSRIEVTPYVHGAADLLGVQIDAAINAGNSGGPAFNEAGECVGIAFQSLKSEDVENVGYIIPTPVIEHFITDFERNGRYMGFPCLGIEWQKMENPHLREGLDMRPGQKGVLVRRIEPTCPASQHIDQYDILMKFDGVDIANDGTVPFRSGERIGFTYLVSRKYIDDEVEVSLLKKGGREMTVNIRLHAPYRLIPVHVGGKPPSYFIIGGLVFTPVTVPYLRSEYGKEYDFDAPVKLLDRMLHSMAEEKEQQVVVLSQVLAADLSIGYEDIVNTQVLALNGQKIHSLRTLVDLVDSCKDKYLHFDLDYNQKVVLEAKAARAATKSVLQVHCIPYDRSEDLRKGPKGRLGQSQ
ncbi:unnamed protein product [Ostreobium quekettii]|uniref:Protease Do-like PDZ domain-containing protein n=1 Tax=Ostreobium quekettii TaxID=121088 RepID=A0A8S1J9Q5_9CHLO|nr:unnamed protein product [Ostreobium quekettii]|eukprot:evm.model.scf_3440.1 EVM.evm.TU.scf_3440.1   scf_3440:2675-9082(-)